MAVSDTDNNDNFNQLSSRPQWDSGVVYKIRPEALTAPFDYPTWSAQGRANADKLPSAVAEALGPERDWADEVWDAANEAATRVGDNPAVDVIRRLCRPISNDTVTDEWLAEALRKLDGNGWNQRAETLRAIITEVTQ